MHSTLSCYSAAELLSPKETTYSLITVRIRRLLTGLCRFDVSAAVSNILQSTADDVGINTPAAQPRRRTDITWLLGFVGSLVPRAATRTRRATRRLTEVEGPSFLYCRILSPSALNAGIALVNGRLTFALTFYGNAHVAFIFATRLTCPRAVMCVQACLGLLPSRGLLGSMSLAFSR